MNDQYKFSPWFGRRCFVKAGSVIVVLFSIFLAVFNPVTEAHAAPLSQGGCGPTIGVGIGYNTFSGVTACYTPTPTPNPGAASPTPTATPTRTATPDAHPPAMYSIQEIQSQNSEKGRYETESLTGDCKRCLQDECGGLIVVGSTAAFEIFSMRITKPDGGTGESMKRGYSVYIHQERDGSSNDNYAGFNTSDKINEDEAHKNSGSSYKFFRRFIWLQGIRASNGEQDAEGILWSPVDMGIEFDPVTGEAKSPRTMQIGLHTWYHSAVYKQNVCTVSDSCPEGAYMTSVMWGAWSRWKGVAPVDAQPTRGASSNPNLLGDKYRESLDDFRPIIRVESGLFSTRATESNSVHIKSYINRYYFAYAPASTDNKLIYSDDYMDPWCSCNRYQTGLASSPMDDWAPEWGDGGTNHVKQWFAPPKLEVPTETSHVFDIEGNSWHVCMGKRVPEPGTPCSAKVCKILGDTAQGEEVGGTTGKTYICMRAKTSSCRIASVSMPWSRVQAQCLPIAEFTGTGGTQRRPLACNTCGNCCGIEYCDDTSLDNASVPKALIDDGLARCLNSSNPDGSTTYAQTRLDILLGDAHGRETRHLGDFSTTVTGATDPIKFTVERWVPWTQDPITKKYYAVGQYSLEFVWVAFENSDLQECDPPPFQPCNLPTCPDVTD